MQFGVWVMGVVAVCLAGAAGAEDQSVYSPPGMIQETQPAVSGGGLNLDLKADYMTAYVYRGVNHSKVGGDGPSANFQFDGRLALDLGTAPHPFVGVFSNVCDADPVSHLQEIRPYFGATWELKPLTLEAGHISYIYPDRQDVSTAEVYGKITLDDSALWRTSRPVLSPYLLGAYDYDVNNGWYLEAGVSHDFVIEDINLTLTTIADIAYEMGIQKVFAFDNPRDEGFQHYDLGLLAHYPLNSLLNVPRRFGQWTLEGYFYYTGTLAEHILADNLFWGGIGIGLKY